MVLRHLCRPRDPCGAEIKAGAVSINDALALSIAELDNHTWAKLMKKQHRSIIQAGTDHSVLTTWMLSFNHLQVQSKDAANILMLWAFLDNQDLWYELFASALDHDIVGMMPDWYIRCAGDELEFKDCIGLLLEYSFIDAKIESSSFVMHPVLHQWSFHVFEKEKTNMSWLAMIIVASAVPLETVTNYSFISIRLLPHCDRVFPLLKHRIQESFDNKTESLSLCYVCHELGRLYADQGKMNKTEEMYLRALTGYEKAWGPEHTSTLDTVNNLGILYADQGKMNDAEEMYLRALTGYEKAWGPEHTSTLDTVKNLGILYKNQGKMSKAEEMYLRALTGKEKAWGPEHTSTLNTVNNLGSLYAYQGKMNDAEEMYLRALTGKEKAWGPEHTSTLNTVKNLGILYADQGKMNDAEEMYLRALTGYEKAWGSEHKRSLDTRYNLGILYKKKSMFEDATHHFKLVVQGYTSTLGSEHWETIDALDQLKSYDSEQLNRLTDASDTDHASNYTTEND